eukprot:CAMPEP_0177677964 /NCGR_PEP_ID=MMETSP0447-20121125/28727_1 /TAXON_ID=0 /ORGANISM="Stygamoeba regulata, Strain BSH-02190019" /LENGTH=57 /DNA_ID=CAMNT_0019186877 /DNA_START=70 /DNA_END=240 /DNA_ORIENTATION=+
MLGEHAAQALQQAAGQRVRNVHVGCVPHMLADLFETCTFVTQQARECVKVLWHLEDL